MTTSWINVLALWKFPIKCFCKAVSCSQNLGFFVQSWFSYLLKVIAQRILTGVKIRPKQSLLLHWRPTLFYIEFKRYTIPQKAENHFSGLSKITCLCLIKVILQHFGIFGRWLTGISTTPKYDLVLWQAWPDGAVACIPLHVGPGQQSFGMHSSARWAGPGGGGLRKWTKSHKMTYLSSQELFWLKNATI